MLKKKRHYSKRTEMKKGLTLLVILLCILSVGLAIGIYFATRTHTTHRHTHTHTPTHTHTHQHTHTHTHTHTTHIDTHTTHTNTHTHTRSCRFMVDALINYQLKHYDFDIEQINDKFDECAEFLGETCKALKKLKPSCIISHAPQPPYFTPSFGSIYVNFYNSYKEYFDWFNIQYYNNGPSDSYEEIFIQSNASVAPNTSVLELMKRGIGGNYIVVGKPMSDKEATEGYVRLDTLSSYVEQAFNDSSLKDWSNTGGEMIWIYNSQEPSGNSDNEAIEKYFMSISNLSRKISYRERDMNKTIYMTYRKRYRRL